MRKYFAVLIFLIVPVIMVWASAAPPKTIFYMEKAWTPANTQHTNYVNLHGSLTGHTFTIRGATDSDSSSVMVLQYQTSLIYTVTASGDSAQLILRAYGGTAYPLASDITKADTTGFTFVLQDTLAITAIGSGVWQITDVMKGFPYFYITVNGTTGNGAVTVFTAQAYRYGVLSSTWVDSTVVRDSSLSGNDLKDYSIILRKIQNGVIDSTKIKTGALSVSDIANGNNGFALKSTSMLKAAFPDSFNRAWNDSIVVAQIRRNTAIHDSLALALLKTAARDSANAALNANGYYSTGFRGKFDVKRTTTSSDTIQTWRSSTGTTVAWVDTLGNLKLSSALSMRNGAINLYTTDWTTIRGSLEADGNGLYLKPPSGGNLFIGGNGNTVRAYSSSTYFTSILPITFGLTYNAPDAGFSRSGADTLNLGNGTAGNATGYLKLAGTIITSDGRLKTDVKDIPYGLREILLLRPVTYNMHQPAYSDSLKSIEQQKADLLRQNATSLESYKTAAASIYNDKTKPTLAEAIQAFMDTQIKPESILAPAKPVWGATVPLSANSTPGVGLIAQEVASVIPDAVYSPDSTKDFNGINYNTLIPILIKAIQELEARVKVLEGK